MFACLCVHSQVKGNPNTRDHYQEQKETNVPVFVKAHKISARDTKKQNIYCQKLFYESLGIIQWIWWLQSRGSGSLPSPRSLYMYLLTLTNPLL